MIVKLDASLLALVGATSQEDFPAKLQAYCANVGKIEASMSKLTEENSTLTARVDALEKNLITEARVKEIVSADGPVSVRMFIQGEEGKSLIKAESSRVFLEAHAATGTSPLKPAPAPTDPAMQVKELVAAGKFEDAYAASRELQAEFPTAGVFAAYARAEQQGRIVLNKPGKPAQN